MIGINVASEVRAHPTRDIGISKAFKTNMYFLVPELTIPQRNWKIQGRVFANSFETHKLSHTISSHEKNHTRRTPPRAAFGLAVAPMTMGTAMMRAKGRT